MIGNNSMNFSAAGFKSPFAGLAVLNYLVKLYFKVKFNPF